MIFLIYSSRIASIAFICKALHAGRHPANKPVTIKTIDAETAVAKEI